jgi:Flp pilus assembly protein TadD
MRMNRFRLAAPALLMLTLPHLTGCESIHRTGLDPLAAGGRAGVSAVSYDALMRIGAAAQGGGDLETAVGLYRRAAELNPTAAAPFAAAGDTLVELGEINEAIVAYRAALVRAPHNPDALRGLARSYLLTGKPELAAEPLGLALAQAPDDPKLLQLIGVAEDFTGRHAAAQARYRRALDLLPGDPGLSVNLALSLALTGNYGDAVAILTPVALGPAGTPGERQSLALIYALQGDDRAAERIARLDLDAPAAQRALAYYDTLRRLSPEARVRAIRAMSSSPRRRPPVAG